MDEALAAEIGKAFSGTVEPVRKSAFYTLGLMIVTVVMAILPVVYVLIVAAAGCGVYYHAVHNVSILSGTGGARFRFLAYFGPLVIGGVLVVFMAIPLIPRFGRRAKPLYVVTERNEPVFYELIQNICKAVGAPRPREIHLIMEPNAYAAFRKGILSFLGHDLVLAVGLPLISGFTIRQLSGVVAHEMGHFSQGLGMRLSYLIDRVNGWFANAVYGNSLEEKLGEAGQQSGGGIGLVLVLSQLFILLTKCVLRLCMMLGYLVSNFFSRQMEYDADLYQLRVAGSKDFEVSMYSLAFLGIGWRNSFQKSVRSMQRNVLSDDLPALVKTEARQIAQQHKDDVINTVLSEETHVFDTHPSCRDRITVAKKNPTEGICRLTGAAKTLFSDYAGLSKRLTAQFYSDVLKRGVQGYKLLPTEEYLSYYEEKQYEFEISNRRA
jgi:Zn-dependent protease with chaperone function